MRAAKQFVMTIVLSSRNLEETKQLIGRLEEKLKAVSIKTNDGSGIEVISVNEIDRPFNEQ